MQGSSAATENPANSLRSLLASFASGHSEDDEDDTSQQKCKCKKDNFFIDKLSRASALSSSEFLVMFTLWT